MDLRNRMTVGLAHANSFLPAFTSIFAIHWQWKCKPVHGAQLVTPFKRAHCSQVTKEATQQASQLAEWLLKDQPETMCRGEQGLQTPPEPQKGMLDQLKSAFCLGMQGAHSSHMVRFQSNYESIWDFWLEVEAGSGVDVSAAAFYMEEQFAHQAVLARLPTWTAASLGTVFYGSWHF